MQKAEITEKGSAQWHRSNCKGWSILIKITTSRLSCENPQQRFLKARSVLGGAFRPTVITLLPVNPWLPPVRFPNWSLSQIQRKMNIQPPFIHLSHPTKEDHLSIGRTFMPYPMSVSIVYSAPNRQQWSTKSLHAHDIFLREETKYCLERDQIFLEERPNIVAGKRLTLSTADSMLFEVLHTEAT